MLTLCHGGTHHNAAFDPETHKITCFSECNTTTMIHTWVCKVLGTTNPNEGREFIEKWIDEAEIDFSDVIPGASGGTKTYHAFDPDKKVDMVKGIDPKILADLYSRFDTAPQTLSRLKWHLPKAQGGDEIPLRQLSDFQVAYLTVPKTVRVAVVKWVYQFLKDGAAPFPLTGDMGSEEYTFTIDFERDVEIVPNRSIKDDMAAYNRQSNAEKGRRRVEKRFADLTGNKWTTAELTSQGFTKRNISAFVENGLIKRLYKGHYMRVSK